MPIIIKKGDLFDTSMPLIAHGVNTRGAFGAGVAGRIASLFPEVRDAYREHHRTHGWRLGEIQVVTLKAKENGGHASIREVANLATQNSCGNDGTKHFSDEGFERAMTTLLQYAREMNLGVAIPKIGAGLAGGDWNEIFRSLTCLFKQFHEETTLEVWV